jgi:hypothetical protein
MQAYTHGRGFETGPHLIRSHDVEQGNKFGDLVESASLAVGLRLEPFDPARDHTLPYIPCQSVIILNVNMLPNSP